MLGKGMSAPTTSFGGSGKANNPSSPVCSSTTGSGLMGMCTWGANDTSRTQITGAGLNGAAGVAIAGIQLFLSEAEFQLAQSYYDTNKTDFDFYKNSYESPLVSHKDQAFSAPFYVQDYYPMTGAALANTKVYDKKWFQSRRRVHRYALGHQKHLDYTYYMLRRKAAFTAWNTGRRVEDGRKDWKDEQIQTHKVQALNFGITAGNIAKQGLASATASLEGAFDEMGSRIGGISNGLSRNSGNVYGNTRAGRILDNSAGGVNMAPHAIGTGGE